MAKTSRRSLLQVLPTVLTFGLFESRVLAEVGVKSPTSLDREVLPAEMFEIKALVIDEFVGYEENFYTVRAVPTEKDARPFVLALLQDMLCLLSDLDFLVAESAQQKLRAAEWLWQVWKVRNSQMAETMVAESFYDVPDGLFHDVPGDLTPQELDDLIAIIRLDALIRVERVPTSTEEAWRELEAKTEEGAAIAARYSRIKKSPGAFLRICQARIIQDHREDFPDATTEEIQRLYPEYFPQPGACG